MTSTGPSPAAPPGLDQRAGDAKVAGGGSPLGFPPGVPRPGALSGDATVAPARAPVARRLVRAFMRTFAKGLIAILPVGAAIIVLAWLAGNFEGVFGAPILKVLSLLGLGHYYVTGMGFVLGLVLIFLLGLFVNALIVRQFLATSEGLLQRLPLAKTVMSSVRDVTGFFSKSEKRQMDQVVVVSLGDSGLKAVGFITREDLSDLPEGLASSQMVSVYMPLSYAIGGFTVLVPRANVRPVKMSMEDAMRFVLTAGMKSEGTKADDAPVSMQP